MRALTPNMEYLCDGNYRKRHQELFTTAAVAPSCHAAPSSAYKGRELDAQQVGKELGGIGGGGKSSFAQTPADSERGVGGCRNGWQLWDEKYDRGAGDIIEVQEEIAGQNRQPCRLATDER